MGPYGSLASSGPHTQGFFPSQEWPNSAALHRSASLDVLSAALNRGLHHDEARMNNRADLVTNPAIAGPRFPSDFGSKFQSERRCGVCGIGAQLRCVQVEVCAIGVRIAICVVCCKSVASSDVLEFSLPYQPCIWT